MAINDLTGTTWLITSNTATAGLGHFSLTGHWSGTYSPEEYYTEGFDGIALGYSSQHWESSHSNWQPATENFLMYTSRDSSGNFNIGDTLEITGGTNATNSTLIAWFEANGTLTAPQSQTLATILFSINNPPYALVPVNIVQKKSISSGSGITNLTGTTWLFNSEFEPSVYEDTFNINFTSNNTDYTVFRRSYFAGCIMYRLNNSDIPGTQVYYFSGQPVPSGATYGWQLEAYRTITITGGADATNSTLISWLQREATFVSGESFQPARLLPTIPPTTFISFTIGNTTYQAEDGMTWYEWVNSEYNTDGYTCTNVNDCVSRSYAYITVNNNFVYGYDIILENQEYVQGPHSG